MKKLLILILFLLLLIGAQVVSPPIFAQNQANCDLCGYCEGQPTPGKWMDCAECVYRDLALPLNAVDNQTLIGPPSPNPDYHYTAIGCISTKPELFTVSFMSFLFSIIGGVAFLFLLYGASIIATSQANPDRLNYGKRLVYGALGGLLFALFATFLIRFIAVDILRIPGFQNATLTATPTPIGP